MSPSNDSAATETQVADASFPPNKSHHVGSPRTHFKNPWPSFQPKGFLDIIKTRFSNDRTFVPVPESRDELVGMRKPDWGSEVDPEGSKLKATWIGHASWLVEYPTASSPEAGQAQDSIPARGVRILFDPVFSERTSPFSFLGPKRYTPTPCSLSELPEVDVVTISHNHYDHLDIDTIKALQTRSSRTHFVCPLGNKDWFLSVGISAARVTELDWWDGVDITVQGKGTVRMVCTPAQHFSSRSINDRDQTLWSSWSTGLLPGAQSITNTESAVKTNSGKTIEIAPVSVPSSIEGALTKPVFGSHRLYFTGDSGYRAVDKRNPSPEEAAAYPHCPAFSTIGQLLGPFDLGLVPIGLYSPRDHMSSVHCAPEDSVLLARDVRAKYAVGMHYGTVRGGLSAYFEDVREPPRRFKAACEREGLKWNQDAGLCDIGETIAVA